MLKNLLDVEYGEINWSFKVTASDGTDKGTSPFYFVFLIQNQFEQGQRIGQARFASIEYKFDQGVHCFSAAFADVPILDSEGK